MEETKDISFSYKIPSYAGINSELYENQLGSHW